MRPGMPTRRSSTRCSPAIPRWRCAGCVSTWPRSLTRRSTSRPAGPPTRLRGLAGASREPGPHSGITIRPSGRARSPADAATLTAHQQAMFRKVVTDAFVPDLAAPDRAAGTCADGSPPAPPGAKLLMMIRTLTGEIPLMSRDAELDRILAMLRGPVPAAFVLAGPAGVGKTRLAAEVAKSAALLGFGTALAVASRAASVIPFGPFAPFLPAAGHSPDDLLGLLRQASDAILERAGPDRRLLLVVDDAQFLDEGSAALVHQLVREEACSVLPSLRTPGPVPDPVTALWKDGLADRIDLRSWGEAETEAVLVAVLGGPIAGGSVRRSWEVSRGNALYLRELLIGAVDSGALSETGGIWSLRQPLAAPGRLVELVAARLAGLAPETVAVIELLVAGEPLGMPVLEQIADPAGLEDAEAQGFVQVQQDGRPTVVRLAHPVYGEALRQSLPRSRLRRISTTLAAAIE